MLLGVILLFLSGTSALIVPEELPSLLSVAYSNIPPIKKGTDSRIGFGFSLGNHADFQVMLELGPQTNTNPIGTPYASSSKRQVKPRKPTNKEKGDSDGSKYLSGWSQTMKKKGAKPPVPDSDSNPHGTVNLHDLLSGMTAEDGKVDLVLKQPTLNVSPDTLNRLKQLYGEMLAAEEASKRPMFVPKTTFVPKQAGNYERLANFKVEEERKRRVTEELSDVNLNEE